MVDQFEYWGITDYTRISAYDGRGDRDLGDILKGRYPDNMSSGEVGCTTSHLKAMKHFLETSDAPCALMMEDDCDISTMSYWQFSWKDFYRKVPYDYDVVQLAVINPASIHMKLHHRFVNDFSTACYMITRRHCQKLMDLHVRGDKYKIDNGVKPRAVADDLIYNSGNTYATHMRFHCFFTNLNLDHLFIMIMLTCFTNLVMMVSGNSGKINHQT
jgi:GR25 family glycosyltransferase involved in LPS biosynthesis